MRRAVFLCLVVAALFATLASEASAQGHTTTLATSKATTHAQEAATHAQEHTTVPEGNGTKSGYNEDDSKPAEHMTERQKVLNYFVSTIGMLVVVLCIYVAHHAHKDWLSESTLVVVAGIVIGGGFALADHLIEGNEMAYTYAVRFDQETFITMLLPIIIFEAGYSLEHGGVMRQIGSIMLFAIPGTLMSTMLIGMSLYAVFASLLPELHDSHGGMFVCLTFGSLLSATDPVAVIAVLGSKYDLTKEPPLMYNLIFGESVLNDAVAIVLFRVFLDFVSHPLTFGNVMLAIGTFLYIFLCSALLGYVIGCLSALFLKKINLNDVPHVEMITLMVFAAASYYLAEYFHLSGIMSIFITARLMGIYSCHNLSETSNKHAAFLFKTAALLAETYVFLFLGAAVWAYEHDWNFDILAITTVIVLISRMFVVFPLSFLSNLRRKVEVITMKMQLFMWFAGLRGAIAFGLCVIFMEEAENKHREAKHHHDDIQIRIGHARTIMTTGLGLILFMVLVMGSLSGPVLKALELDKAQTRAEIEADLEAEGKLEKRAPSVGRKLMVWLNKINDTKIRPILQRGYVKTYFDDLEDEMIPKTNESETI